MAKLVDATSIFFEQKQEGEVDLLLREMNTYDLHPTLSDTIDSINRIDAEALSVEGKEKFQTLCGLVHNVHVDQLVHVIHDAAWDLRREKQFSPDKVKKLKAALADLWERYSSFSEENLGFIKSILAIVNGVSTPYAPSGPEEGDKALELFMVAGLFYEGKLREGMLELRKLSPSLQHSLGDEEKIENNVPLFIQKVVQLAYEKGRQDGYQPSPREIETILAEGTNFA